MGGFGSILNGLGGSGGGGGGGMGAYSGGAGQQYPGANNTVMTSTMATPYTGAGSVGYGG